LKLPVIGRVLVALVWLLSWLLPPLLLSLAVGSTAGPLGLVGLALGAVGSVVGIALAGITARRYMTWSAARGIRRRTRERQGSQHPARTVEEHRKRSSRGGLVD
jgi:hypothetical protein